LGRLRARRGDPRAWEALDEALDLAAPRNELQHVGNVRAVRAEAAWLEGDRERMVVDARAAYPLAVPVRDPLDPRRARALAVAGRRARRAGPRARGASLRAPNPGRLGGCGR